MYILVINILFIIYVKIENTVTLDLILYIRMELNRLILVFILYNMKQEENQPICSSISIQFNLTSVGLVGGEYASKPSVHTWCSFNPHRIIKSQKLKEVTPPCGDDEDTHAMLSEITSDYGNYGENRVHKFNGQAYDWMCNFGLQQGLEDSDNEYDLGDRDDGEEEEEKMEFTIPQNKGVYETKEDIIYDLSNEMFHGKKNLRTDSSIWLKLMSVSLYSGIPKIDENDRKFKKVERDIQAGICQLELYDLFKECTRKTSNSSASSVSFTFESAFVDPKIMNYEMAELCKLYYKEQGKEKPIPKVIEQLIKENAFLKTRKGVIDFTVTVKDFNYDVYRTSLFSQPDLKTSPLKALMDMRSTTFASYKKKYASIALLSNNTMIKDKVIMSALLRKDFDPILYNSSPGIAELRNYMEYVLQVYCNSFITLDNREECKYQASNKNVKKLHLPMFVSEQGQTPVINFFSSHTPNTREYPNEEMRRIERELYGFDDATEDHFLLMTRASLLRHGMSEELFIKTIRHHMDNNNKDGIASGLYVIALKIIADIGTFAANSSYYTSDFRYLKLDNNAFLTGKTIASLPEEEKKKFKYEKTARFRKINLDSFDSTIINGTGNAGDCEDQGNVACTILECFGYGRYNYNEGWKSSLLSAVQSVLKKSIIFAIASTVTSAYVDNNNKPIDMKEESRNLPVIGDQIDLNSRCDGHCYGMLIPVAITDRLLTNSNLDKKELTALRDTWIKENNGIQFNKRDYTVPIMVLEGTGSVEPTILPVDEIFDFKERQVEKIQAHTAIAFMKAIKAKIASILPPSNDKTKSNIPLTTSQQEMKDIMDMFNGEGIEYYVEKRPLNERVSRFYREVIHGVSCDLYMKNIALSQVAFCKKKPNSDECTYGVNTGELLRSGLTQTNNIALITPFANNVQEWKEKIIPMTESIQNQMPIMQFGCYTDDQYKNDIYSRPMRFGVAFAGKNIPTISMSHEKMKSIIESVSGNPDLAVIRLQSREWKLTDNTRIEKLIRFLSDFKGVVCIGFYSNKHIACCDALVDIIIVVKTIYYYKKQ